MTTNNSRISRSLDEIFESDKILTNNPVLVEGLALAPVIVAAVSLKNAVILSIVIAVISIPTRILGNLLIGIVPQRLRAMVYAFMASLMYVPAVLLVTRVLGFDVINLGLYLPILVADTIVLMRTEIPTRETFAHSVLVSVGSAVGAALVLWVVGALRETIGQNRIWGVPIEMPFRFSVLSTTAGGLIIVALLCAVTQKLSVVIKRAVYRRSGNAD